MLKQILPYFLLAVALVLCFMLWQSNRELAKLRTEDNRRLNSIIDHSKGQIALRDDSISRLWHKINRDNKIHDSTQHGFKSKLKGLQREQTKIASQKLTVPALDTIASRYEVISDSVYCLPLDAARPIFTEALLKTVLEGQIIVLSQQVVGLERARTNLFTDFIDMENQYKGKLAEKDTIITAKDELLAKETRDHRKTKRRSALKSVGLGILSAGIIYISIRE